MNQQKLTAKKNFDRDGDGPYLLMMMRVNLRAFLTHIACNHILARVNDLDDIIHFRHDER